MTQFYCLSAGFSLILIETTALGIVYHLLHSFKLNYILKLTSTTGLASTHQILGEFRLSHGTGGGAVPQPSVLNEPQAIESVFQGELRSFVRTGLVH